MMRFVWTIAACATVGVLCGFTAGPAAQPEKGPEGPWIVDDLDKGLAEAKKTGKPLMIVFR